MHRSPPERLETPTTILSQFALINFHPMNSTLPSIFMLAGFASVLLVSSASAAVSIDYVSVGYVNNAADSTGYGAVAYEYKIAKNETTIGQYAEFLNAKAKSDPYLLYNTSMTAGSINGISRSGSSGSYSYAVNPGSANKPITYVSWFDAARFCNWLHNGQGNGSSETGAYTLNGAMSGIYTVNAGARAWIPSEDEWYKAAYYDASKGGYWLYPTQSNSVFGNTIGNANSANYFDGDYVGSGTSTRPSSNALTDVGAYGANSDSFFGTNDQGGNVLEWTDAMTGSSRGLRGGSWDNGRTNMASSSRNYQTASLANSFVGFRVASVPEPSSLILTLLASGMWVARRKR
jgi:formylglycine-generating enzyme required for sulfatase activity